MTEHPGSNAQSITGIWQGTYCYPFGLGPVFFMATLIEAGSSLTGTTHEAGRWTVGSSPDVTLCASLSGSRHGGAVAFVKTYNGGNPHYRPIDYEGHLERRWNRDRGALEHLKNILWQVSHDPTSQEGRISVQ